MGTLSLITWEFYSEIKMMKLLISTLLVLIVSTLADEEVINWTAKEYASMVLHGDEKVVFSFTANHNLYQFNNKNAYTNCNFNNAVLIEEGPAEVEIDGNEETKYFGCFSDFENGSPSSFRSASRTRSSKWPLMR